MHSVHKSVKISGVSLANYNSIEFTWNAPWLGTFPLKLTLTVRVHAWIVSPYSRIILNCSLAVGQAGTCMTLSAGSTSTIEDVASSSSGLKWFQLHFYKDQDVIIDLIRRAERAGFKAIAVTVDAPYLGRRYADVRNKFGLPPHLTLANYTDSYATGVKSDKDSGLAKFIASLIDSSLTWDFILWLRSVTKLQIVLKGILTAEDARLAVQYGVDGILVSNHGARQLDTVPATVTIAINF